MASTDVYKIIAGCVVPRPIGFVSTVSRDGIHNAAPFSFFNAISHNPPMVCLSISPIYKSGQRKDTLKNITDIGDFVANMSTKNWPPRRTDVPTTSPRKWMSCGNRA